MNEVVFLVDVDNTLLDNDRIREDIQRDFEAAYGAQSRDRYWTIQERLFVDLGYRDYLGALQIYRKEYPEDMRVLSMASYLIDYPFADRVYPGALAVLRRLREWGVAVILTDGDVVFQPRKVERAGLAQAVDGNVLVYVHKEAAVADIERHYPARHYVVVDDKLRLLDAIKRIWAKRVTTVFVRQGAFAHDAAALASLAPADVTIEHIADLPSHDLAALLAAARQPFR
jgi:FMN phosphatase YigB (HAD superfamily)